MTAPLCPSPASCPVPDPAAFDVSRARLVTWPAGQMFHRVYDTTWGRDAFNPGKGSARFSPLVSKATPIPALYGADTREAALLESVFHDVGHGGIVYERTLLGLGLVTLRTTVDLTLVDMRDVALAEYGLSRDQLITTPASHYPCTREWGLRLRDARSPSGAVPAGLAWYSRQAEINGVGDVLTVVLYGDRAPSDPGSYEVVAPGVASLVAGPGRVILDEVADSLDVIVEPL